MSKINLLIYKNIDDLKPTGGPNGYLYNLNLGLKEINQPEINVSFLETGGGNNREKKLKSLASKLPKNIFNFFWNLWMKKYCNSIIKSNGLNKEIDFSKYDLIHFHSTLDLYLNRNSLEKYCGKIILSSHSPKPFHQELMDALVIKSKRKTNMIQKSLEKIDIYSFTRADFIIFPCEEAEEPYYNQWEMYNNIKEENKNKFNYLITGIKKCTAKIDSSKIRKLYNIPSDAFLISYAGRHNSVKGYDLLKKIGEKVLNRKTNIYVICAGSEGPIYRLENRNWIEIGWTNDPHSIINASDLFILPNRETYFDLVLLEVLSLGIPALVSYTGGNKYFKQFEKSGIFFFESIDEACSEIFLLSEKSNKEMLEFKKSVECLFENKFTEKCFSENYIKLIKEIYNK